MTNNYILCIESSGLTASVSIVENGASISFSQSMKEQSASSTINAMIETALSSAQISIKELKAVALSGGPGSYTGLRIGAATAKGICLALDLPLIHISTLQIMAASIVNLSKSEKNYKKILPIIDARNNNYYVGLYSKELVQLSDTSFLNINDSNFQEYLHDDNTFIVCNKTFPVKRMYLIHDQKISSDDMDKLASESYKNRKFESLEYYEPNYLTGFNK